MQYIVIEQLKKKYLLQIMDLLQTDKKDAEVPDGMRPEQWHAVCSGKIEVLVESLLDLVEESIKEEQEAIAAAAAKPAKRGNYKGLTVDGMVENGEYV